MNTHAIEEAACRVQEEAATTRYLITEDFTSRSVTSGLATSLLGYWRHGVENACRTAGVNAVRRDIAEKFGSSS